MAKTEREQRFRALYGASRARLVAYALRRAPPEEAADAVAESLAVAWRRLDEVPDGDAGVIWLLATARNVLANQGRKRARAVVLVERLAHELHGSHVFGTPAQDGEALVARRVLAELSDDDREILMLVAWDGLGGGELAAVLGCSPNAARIRLHWARARLQAKLREQPGTPKHRPQTGHLSLEDIAPQDAEGV